MRWASAGGIGMKLQTPAIVAPNADTIRFANSNVFIRWQDFSTQNVGAKKSCLTERRIRGKWRTVD
jgi:hypothetical protein